jgi:hypothetical protein
MANVDQSSNEVGCRPIHLHVAGVPVCIDNTATIFEGFQDDIRQEKLNPAFDLCNNKQENYD